MKLVTMVKYDSKWRRRGLAMLNLVICDDEKQLRNDLRRVLETELMLCGEEYRITEYDCGEALLRALDDNPYDIIFLDIEMKELDGVQTAREIRRHSAAPEIIFVTSYPDFVFQGYEVQALNYILKPYRKEKILSVLHTAMERLGRNEEKYYLLQQRGQSVRLPLSKTKYFSSDRRTISAVTTGETYTFYGKLSDLEAELPEYFIRIHNRYLVNLKHITSVQGSKAILAEEELPVSRSCKQELAVAFAKYMLG